MMMSGGGGGGGGDDNNSIDLNTIKITAELMWSCL